MNEDLQTVCQRVSLITSDIPLDHMDGAHQNSLLAAIAVIGAHDGFDVQAGSEALDGLSLENALSRIAVLSGFRFRKVKLGADWWRRERRSKLVTFVDNSAPMAVVWHKNRYVLQDAGSGAFRRLRSADAKQSSNVAFQFYPGLREKFSRHSMIDFCLHRSKSELKALFWVAALATVIGLIVPVATSVVISTAIPDGRTDLLIEMAALVGAGAVGILTLGIVRSLITIRLESLINMRLQSAVWDRVLRPPSTFFRSYSSGDLVRRVLAVDECRRHLTGTALAGFLGGVFSIVSFVLMMIYDMRLAIYGVAYAALTISILAVFAFMQVKHVRQYQLSQGQLTSRILSLIGGVNKLRLATAEERGLLHWSAPFARQQGALWQLSSIRALKSTFTSVIGPIGIAGAIFVAGFRAEHVGLSAFTALNAAFGQFIAAISGFGVALNALVSAVPLLDRAAPVLQATPEASDAAADLGKLIGAFEFHDVSFAYDEEGPQTLTNVSFRVEPGEFVALVGASGARKSTILRRLLGFQEPTAGAVFYGDYDLAHLDHRLVRQRIGTVLQSVGLLPGSLYDNIAGAQSLSDEEVIQAARDAALADDIAMLPMGLDTFVSEDAGNMSGGQRQHIMIARALVGKPRIIFLDEATSALDNHT